MPDISAEIAKKVAAVLRVMFTEKDEVDSPLTEEEIQLSMDAMEDPAVMQFLRAAFRNP